MTTPKPTDTDTKKTNKNRFQSELVLDFIEEAPHLEEAQADEAQTGPIRTCVASRQRKEKSDLLRFVLSPEGVVVPDVKVQLPGRGVWVTSTRIAVEQAVKKRSFHKGFKREVVVPSGLSDNIEQLLRTAALQYLSIANKAGLVVTGFTKVEEAAKRGDLIAVLHAEEAADDGRLKLDRKFMASRASGEVINPKMCFTADEISLAAGSINVIHAGLKEGGASRAFLNAVKRWTTYRTGEVDETRTLCQGRE
jgi:uncharacterized protein